MRRYVSIALLLWNCFAVGQVQNQVWYLGEQAGLKFGDGPPTILLDNSSGTSSACGSICDVNGDVVFYASVHTIRNGQHVALANGTGFAYSQAAPSPLVVPFPGHPGEYFVVGWRSEYAPAIRRQYYQHVDMNQNSGQGAVLQKDVLLCDSVGNGVVAIPHCNGEDYWVVMHERHTNVFLSYQVNMNGWSISPVVSQIGPDHPYWMLDWDYMQASPSGNSLAYAYTSVSGRRLDTYDFDRCTGEVTSRLAIGSGEWFYKAEFSPNGEVLYAVVNDCAPSDTSHLWQYDLSSSDSVQIMSSRVLLHSDPGVVNCTGRLLGCSLAPDGKLYIARMGATCIAVVHSPDAIGSACGFDLCGQDLGGRVCRTALPHQIRFLPGANTISEAPDGPEPIRIHPTPASDGFWLDTDLATHLELLDLQGRMVQRARVNGTGPHWLPREGLGAGTYLLRAFSARGEVIGYGRVVFR